MCVVDAKAQPALCKLCGRPTLRLWNWRATLK